MTDSDIKEFKAFILEVLIEKYHLIKSEAQQAINNSYLTKQLNMDKNFVSHDTVEEWAEYIYGEMRCK